MAHSEDLELPRQLREGIRDHLNTLREAFRLRHWGGRSGFGEKPAVIVIDLANAWTDPKLPIGTNLDSVVENTCKVLKEARDADIPIFFTVVAYAPDDPRAPWDLKLAGNRTALALDSAATQLDQRLGRRPTEKLIVKKYESCFKGTDLHDMLSNLGIDTLIVTGCSTLHCVHATCADATSSFRVIVPEEAVGDRCELFHLVGLLDIDLTKADVVPVEMVIANLRRMASR